MGRGFESLQARMSRYCRMFTKANAEVFPRLDYILASLGVRAKIHLLASGGRIYEVHEDDYAKLPFDEMTGEHYLGDKYSGYSLYELDLTSV